MGDYSRNRIKAMAATLELELEAAIDRHRSGGYGDHDLIEFRAEVNSTGDRIRIEGNRESLEVLQQILAGEDYDGNRT